MINSRDSEVQPPGLSIKHYRPSRKQEKMMLEAER
jgi:hypothetical protein